MRPFAGLRVIEKTDFLTASSKDKFSPAPLLQPLSSGKKITEAVKCDRFKAKNDILYYLRRRLTEVFPSKKREY